MKIAEILDLAFPQRGWSSSCASNATDQEQYDGITWPAPLGAKPTLAAILAQEATAIAALAAMPKTLAKLIFADTAPDGQPPSIAQRGAVLVTLDEINALRQTLAAIKAAFVASSTYANLKTGVVAAIPAMADRTPAQIRPAIRNKIDAE